MAETPALCARVIDDEPALRALLVDLRTLPVGVETLDVDFLMPGLTGTEVVEALQQQRVIVACASASRPSCS